MSSLKKLLIPYIKVYVKKTLFLINIFENFLSNNFFLVMVYPN